MSPPGGSAGPVLTISTEILVASVIFLFVTVVFVVFLYLYVKHNWGHAARLRRRHLFVIEADPPAAAHAATRRGLDPAILSALPVTIYRSPDTDTDSSPRLECAVCLCHVSDGEKARLLPRCRHGFHVECIDMWFHSHSTCPLCRSPVVHPSAVESSEVGQQGASSSGLVIEIPRRQQQQQQQQQQGIILEDDDKSPASATSLRSLKVRLWSRGKREDHVSVDVEQGFATCASASAGGGGGRGSAPGHTPDPE